MARELSDNSLIRLRPQFDDEYWLNQVSIGNMTAEDASFLFSIPLEEGMMTAPETIDALSSILGALDQDVYGSIDDFVQAETLLAEELYGNVMGDYMAFSESIEATADRLEFLIRNQLGDELAGIGSSLDEIQGAVLGVPTAQVKAIENLDTDLSDRIFGWLGDQSESILGVLSRETDDILGELSEGWELVQSTADEVTEKTTNFATALRETIPEIGETIVEGLDGVGEKVTSGFTTAFTGVIESLGAKQLFDLFQLIGGALGKMGEELGGLDDLEVRPGSWDVPASQTDVMNMWLMSAPFLGTRLGLQYPNEVERLRQNAFEWSRPTLLDPGSALEFIRRYPNRESVTRDQLEKAGYSDFNIEKLKLLSFSPLALSENIVALRRGFISPEIFAEKLRALGLAPDDVSLAEQLSMQLPPIGDLIRMVVRDTFEPQVVDTGKLSEGFENFPVEIAEQLGIPPEWSEKYWQAHWELPSLQQGFEMLHRGEIDRDALLALFKAADLAPGYWQPMEAISFRPFTRVDTRRMHAFGILDAEGVKRSYLDIGYNEEKAQALTDFTIAYNDSTRKVEKTRERDLSKSDIIGMYNDGVIDALATRDYLIKLGYSEDEATVLIDREDIQEMRRERKADIANIIDQAKIKALTYEEAQDRLAALDLTRTETNKALADLARVSQTRTRTPSKSDLDQWLALGLLTSGDYAEELRTLGFAERYVDLYVEATTAEEESDLLAQEEKAARRREPRAVSKGNLDSLYQAEIIDVAGYTEGLTTLGYRERDIANLLEQQTLKLEERQRDEIERLERGEEAAQVERLPSRSLLGKLYLKGLITIEAYQDGLTLLGFNPENVQLLSKLITAKGEENASEPAGVA